MSIANKIERAHYVATPEEVEVLAREQWRASEGIQRTNETYTRILLTDVQAQLGTRRRGARPGLPAALRVIDASHGKFYAAVLKGITTPDIAAEEDLEPAERSRRSLERNRRSNFARTAKSTLVAFVRGGGDLRALKPAETSKSSLRRAVAPPESANPIARRVERAEATLLRAWDVQAKKDADVAIEYAQRLIEQLQARLDSLDVEPSDTMMTATRAPSRATHPAPALHSRAA